MNPILEALREAFPSSMGAARAEDLETGPVGSIVNAPRFCHYCPLGALSIAIDPELGNGQRYGRFPYHLDGAREFMQFAGIDPNKLGYWRLQDNVYWEARTVTQNADLQPDPEIETAWEALGRLMVLLGYGPREGDAWSQ